MSILLTPAGASAATIEVDTTIDFPPNPGNCQNIANDCSVRQAINFAQPGDTVAIPAGTYGLDASNGEIPIDTSMAIQGAGAALVTIDAGGLIRVFNVGGSNPAATVTIDGVTITGGQAPDGATGAPGGDGGAILNAADLSITDSVVGSSQAGAGGAGQLGAWGAPGGDGGAISSSGTLSLTDTTISGSTAGEGGQAGPANSNIYGGGGPGGSGGGVQSSGQLTLSGATVTGNVAGKGGANNSIPTVNGAGGNGGGIASTGGSLSISGGAVSSNTAGAGGDGSFGGPGLNPGGGGGGVYSSGQLSITGATLEANAAGAGGENTGPGGRGGGLVKIGSQGGTITDTSLLSNRAGGGTGGQAPPPDVTAGAGGPGGGIYTSSPLTIESSTLAANMAGDGAVGALPPAAGAGDGGDGGAIFSHAPLVIVNSTLTLNSGGAGGAAQINPGAGGSGGALYSSGGLTMVSSTAANNEAGDGHQPGIGGGVTDAGGTTLLRNSLLAGNTASPGSSGSNCAGTITDGGNNLGFPAAGGCPAGFSSQNPRLDPDGLQSNGGPTQTIALEPGSGAVDGVPIAACTNQADDPLTADQRGFPRPVGGACDIGAFEAQVACDPLTLSTDEGQPVQVSLACTGSAPLTYGMAENPDDGQISDLDPAGGTLTYTPDPGFEGTDSFIYQASGADGQTGGAVVTVTVNADPPSCQNLSPSTALDRSIQIQLNCVGIGVLAYAIVQEPAHGTIYNFNPTSGTFVYVPNPGYSGPDTLLYEATNGGGASNPASVSITILPSNAFKLGGVKRNMNKGTARLVVELPGPGVLELTGRGLKARRQQAEAGDNQLLIVPTGKAKLGLKASGKARVSLGVTFTPTGGEPNTETEALKLKRR